MEFYDLKSEQVHIQSSILAQCKNTCPLYYDDVV